MFHNLYEYEQLYPEHETQWQELCLPRIESRDDPRLAAIRAELAPLPETLVTQDADLHLVVDGKRIDATKQDPKTWTFELPAAASSIRLVSNKTRPSLVRASSDRRLLGVCVRGLSVSTGETTTAIAMAAGELTQGFYAAEQSGSGDTWRWTNGDAELPVGLIGKTGEPSATVVLTVTATTLATYLRDKDQAAA
jgi:hypothetical protein